MQVVVKWKQWQEVQNRPEMAIAWNSAWPIRREWKLPCMQPLNISPIQSNPIHRSFGSPLHVGPVRWLRYLKTLVSPTNSFHSWSPFFFNSLLQLPSHPTRLRFAPPFALLLDPTAIESNAIAPCNNHSPFLNERTLDLTNNYYLYPSLRWIGHENVRSQGYCCLSFLTATRRTSCN